MNLDIFDSTRHWSYSADDELAEIEFSTIEKEAREKLPPGFFDSTISVMQGAPYLDYHSWRAHVSTNHFAPCRKESFIMSSSIAVTTLNSYI